MTRGTSAEQNELDSAKERIADGELTGRFLIGPEDNNQYFTLVPNRLVASAAEVAPARVVPPRNPVRREIIEVCSGPGHGRRRLLESPQPGSRMSGSLARAEETSGATVADRVGAENLAPDL